MSQKEEEKKKERRAREGKSSEEPGEKSLGALGKLIIKALKCLKSIVIVFQKQCVMRLFLLDLSLTFLNSSMF